MQQAPPVVGDGDVVMNAVNGDVTDTGSNQQDDTMDDGRCSYCEYFNNVNAISNAFI